MMCAVLGCGRIGFDAPGGAGSPSDGDGGTGDDGGTVDAAITTSSDCPTTVALSDDFTSPTTLPIWTPFTGTNMSYSQGSGYLELLFGSGTTPAGSRTGYTQTTPYDFTESCAIVELAAVPAGGFASMQVGTNAAFADFEYANGKMILNHKGGVLGGPTYDPVAHRFLRLRVHAGTWYWEASPDGMTYTTLTSATGQFVANPAAVTLQLGASGGVQNGGSANFRNAQVFVP